ncbi:unnamed protein product [Polarella glacialis]|uniref:Uncharacterized protein n=1 Tax=Polarella glacialis TaxID=89957 RepID=A0A813LD37_POLGL|nr:unnamed protein product [Polarella glacialis]
MQTTTRTTTTTTHNIKQQQQQQQKQEQQLYKKAAKIITPPASPMMRCHSQWISELKEGDQISHERCNGEAVVATVLEVYQACRLEYWTLVKDDLVPPVEKRALRLRELQDLRSLIKERCVAESWHDQETLKPLLPEEVNLYHLNHFLICPSTVPEGVLIHCPGIDAARARCGQVVVQSDPNSAWADQVVGEGEVTGVLGVDGQEWLIVRVWRVPPPISKAPPGIELETQSNPDAESKCPATELSHDVRPNKVSLSYQEVLRYSKGLLPEAVAPNWFCSHWWGEAVLDFIKCCEKHVAIHQLGAESAYWVCAYANRQHELGVDLGSDPMQSSFLKAMELSQGVLLILDPEATPFLRIWCCFEGGVVSLAQRGALSKQPAASSDCPGRETLPSALHLDIATVDGNGMAQLITQRLTKQEEKVEESRAPYAKSGWEFKSERERGFPIELVRKGLRVKITKAEASKESDKTQILNVLAGRPIDELEAEPDYHHPMLCQVDTTLRGMFAAAVWLVALKKDAGITEGADLPMELLEAALREDVSRQELEMNLQGVATQHHLSALCKAVEPLKNLTRFHLDLSQCRSLTSIAKLGHSLERLTNLRQLSVNLAFCKGLTSIAELAHSLGALTNLQQLTVNLRFCEGLASIAELGRSLERLTNLQQLSVNLRFCEGLTSIAELAHSLGALTNLQQLTVDLAFCAGLTSIAELGRSLERLTNLRQLTVNLEDCTGLTRTRATTRTTITTTATTTTTNSDDNNNNYKNKNDKNNNTNNKNYLFRLQQPLMLLLLLVVVMLLFLLIVLVLMLLLLAAAVVLVVLVVLLVVVVLLLLLLLLLLMLLLLLLPLLLLLALLAVVVVVVLVLLVLVVLVLEVVMLVMLVMLVVLVMLVMLVMLVCWWVVPLSYNGK